MPPYPARMTKYDPVKYFKTIHEIIRLAVMLYVRFRYHCGTLSTCFTNEVSMLVTKRCCIDGIGFGHPRGGRTAHGATNVRWN